MLNCYGRPPRIALVGCGWFARAAHLPALVKLSQEGLVEIVAICSLSTDSLAVAQKIIGKPVEQFTNFDQMLLSEKIDLVDLVLPTPMMDLAIYKSFLAGKHVISEKPCSSSVSKCVELLSVFNRCDAQLTWSVAENWRYKPTVIAIENIIKQGVLKKIESINFTFKTNGWNNDTKGWRSSADYRGGYLLDSGVHFVSMLRLLAGSIKEVNAKVGWRSPSYIADKVNADLIYENNILGKFVINFSENPTNSEKYHLNIKSNNGFLMADLSNNNIILQSGNINQKIEVPNDSWVEGGVYNLLRSCCESLMYDLAPSYAPIEALKDVAVIEAMIESDRLSSGVSPFQLYKTLNNANKEVKTYQNLFNFKPINIVTANSITETRIAVKEAAASGLKIRTIGLGNNWTNYSSTNDVSINLNNLNGIFT